MTQAVPASASAAPIQPQAGTIPAAHLQHVLAAFNAVNLAASYIERGNLAAARRKLVLALASINEAYTPAHQGGAV